jgi:hypothetical protein
MSNRTAHEELLWAPEPIWKARTCFILASGPSMTQEIADRLRGQAVMVINSTYRLAPWADVWFFTDNNIFEEHRAAIETWPGHVITLSRIAKRELPAKIKRLKVEWSDRFLPPNSPIIRQGRSSGHTAISVAIALGTKRIVLLGYDMRVVDGREHHHNDYAGRPRDLDIYEREFLPAFAGWNETAKAVGVEVLNATPNSALTEFPIIALDEALACAAS